MAFSSVTQPPDDSSEAYTPSDEDQAILDELNERYDYASMQWAPIVTQADIDVRYAAGHTFDAADKTARAGRITIELDQISQYLNQLVNSFRLNPRAAKVSPAGGGATDETAELHANRIRQIEHDSHAQEIYTVAGENMATRGYGYARIVPEYEAGESRNQVLRLKAIPNPNQVLPDPDAESTSGADWQYLFFVHTITTREFKRDYPDAQVKDFDPALMAAHPKWFPKIGRVQIAEYWYVTETPPANGEGKPKRTVCQYMTNGVELLAKKGQKKKTEWKGSTIPFAMAAGQIVYETDDAGDTQKMLQSYHRRARDAAKAYNWTASTKLEVLALPVKAALFAYEGQLDVDNVALVVKSMREQVPLIVAKATTEATGTNVLPLPQYGMRAPDISGYEIAGESFRRDVQNALGRYSVQDHRQGSTKVTSGVALRELDKSGDLGSYHYVAHYDDFVRQLAVQLNELLPFYDDTPKEISTRLPDGSTKRVWVNRMTDRDEKGNPAYAKTDLRFDPAALHTVTISTGPASDSQQEANSDFADHVIDSPQLPAIVGPQKMSALLALAIKLKGAGAIGDQMAEIVDPQQGKDGQQPPDPRQLQQHIDQITGQLQHAEGVMKAQAGELASNQAELDSKEKIAQLQIDSKERMAALDREKAITVAELGAKVDRIELFLEERARIGAHLADAATQASDQLHEHVQDDLARTHAAGEAERGRQHQVGLAAAGEGAAAAAQAAGHANTLEVGQQAADLAPAPDNTGE